MKATTKLPDWHEFSKDDNVLLCHTRDNILTDSLTYGLRDYNNTISIAKETVSAVKKLNSTESIQLTIEEIEKLYEFAQKMKNKKLPKCLIVNL